MNDKINQLKTALRDLRLKSGCDYAILFKYGELHILCTAVWVDIIKEAAQKLDLAPTFQTFEFGT